MARFVVMCVNVSRDSRGPSPAGFLFIENWDSGGFCGHKSGHSSWQTYHMARCLLPGEAGTTAGSSWGESG